MEVVYAMIDRGPIFCHVVVSKTINHDILLRIWGNHKWRGAIAIFRRSLKVKRVEEGKTYGAVLNIKIDINIKAEPMACIRKYLVADSSSWWFDVDKISGINDIKLTSILVHNIIQFDDVIIMIVEITKVEENKIVLGDKFLSIIYKNTILLGPFVLL